MSSGMEQRCDPARPVDYLPHLNGRYYGDTIGGLDPSYPLNQWITFDVIAHRTNGWKFYEDGVLRSESRGSDLRIFKDWDLQRAIWWWLRHMHGGNPDQLHARWNYNEYGGGFKLFTA